MKVLVTGGAGFIGSHIVDKLVAEQCQVVIIDNLSTGLIGNVNKAARFVEGDIRSNELIDLFAAEKFDYVIHQAAQTMVPSSLEDPKYDCDVNIAGTLNVLEASRKTGVKRVVFASSAAVYGNVETVPVVETQATNPTSFYGLSKLTAEKYLALYRQFYGLEYNVLRYANVYGERQGDAGEGGVISIFVRKFSRQQPLVIHGDGNQTRDFIYVGDVAAANYQAMVSTEANAIYNVSTKTETSINTLVEIMSRVAGTSVPIMHSPAREGDIYRSTLCNDALKCLNWKPETELIEGLTKTYAFLSDK